MIVFDDIGIIINLEEVVIFILKSVNIFLKKIFLKFYV